MIAVADAVGYAHSKGVVHRDLKPLNVLVGEFGETLVIDWGLAKDTNVPEQRRPGVKTPPRGVETVAGAVFGTPGWMAPEQARGEPLDVRADVYAMGAILYTVCTGRLPFEGTNSRDLMDMVSSQQPTPIEALEPSVPPDLTAIVRTAMAFDREQRYPTARELAEDLRNFQTGKLVAARTYRSRELISRWIRRNRTSIGLTAIFFLGLAILGAAALVRVVKERRVAVEQRVLADQHAREADRARRESERQTAILTLAQARSSTQHDPAQTLAWLKRLAASPARDAVPWADVRLTAADAVARGVARHRLRGHAGAVWHITTTRDGRIVTGGNDGKLGIWDVTSGRVIRAPAGAYSAFAVAPDGRSAAGGETAVTLFDASGVELHRFSTRSEVLSLAFSPDASVLAVGTHDGTVIAISLADSSTRELALTSAVRAIGVAASGAIVTGSDDGIVRAWRAGASAPDATMVLGESVLFATVDSRADRVVVAGNSQLVDWDFARRQTKPLGMIKGELFGLTRSSDSHWLGVCAEGGARIIDLTGVLPERRIDGAEWIAFSHDERTVAVTGKNLVRVVTLENGAETQLQSEGLSSGAAFTADDKTVVTASFDGSLQVWSLPTPNVRGWHEPDRVRQILTMKDGASLVWRRPGHIIVGAIATGATVDVPIDGFPTSFALADEPGHLWVGTDRGQILDVNWLERSVHVVGKLDQTVVCVSEHAGMLAFAGTLHAVHVIDSHTFHELASFTTKDDVNVCAFAPNGRLALAFDNGLLQTVDPRTGQVLDTDHGHQAQIGVIRVAHDGQILTGAREGDVRSWLPGHPSRVVVHHDAAIWGIAVSDDGQRIATSGSDQSVRLSTIDGKVLQVFRGYQADVPGVTFAPDRSWLASSTMDGTVRVSVIDESQTPPDAPEALSAWLDARTSEIIADDKLP